MPYPRYVNVKCGGMVENRNQISMLMTDLLRVLSLTPSPIGRHALVGQPRALWHFTCLPEHVDRHAAARIPVAADAQEMRFQQVREPVTGQSEVNSGAVKRAT